MHYKIAYKNILRKYTFNKLVSFLLRTENITFKGEKPMLSKIINESLIRLKVSANDWEDAVRKSASALLENNKISASYIDAMINTAKEVGPYIVITKHVALPHARPEAGAKEIAIGIATLEHPVEFGNAANDPVKYVFSLSAVDQNTHLQAMAELAELLDKEEFYNVLDKAESAEEVMNYIRTYEA
jgi:mannitol/fructose-specific phosphotransferase system IIA component (Ntr-type)